MRSIERRFKNIQEKNDLFSTYSCFASAVSKQGFSKASVTKWFYKLVDQEDYAWDERRAVINHLDKLSKGA